MADVRIGYITSDFAQLKENQKATLLCNGKKLNANIYLWCYVPTVIKYGSQTNRIDAGKFVSLLCNGKLANSDIVIEALAKGTRPAGIYYFNDDDGYNVWELYSSWEEMNINVAQNYTSSTYQTNALSGYNNVESIGYDMVLISIPKVTSIGNYCFYNSTKLYEIEIADGLTSIGTYAFRGCSNLKSIKIPNSVTSIGTYVFGDCTSLETAEIGSAVASIPQNAFRGCSNLKTIKVNGSPSSISTYAFQGCTSLQVLDLRNATSIITLSNKNAFTNVPSTCKIIVPDSLYDDWINATNWSSLTQEFVMASDFGDGDVITDLTNTSWRINEGWTAEAGYGRFSIDFGVNTDQYITESELLIGYQVRFNDYGGADITATSDWVTSGPPNVMRLIAGSTIFITGGTDVTNPDLIAWLQANATML